MTNEAATHPGDMSRGDNGIKVQQLLDKQEIHEALMRYCRGIDRGDVDLVLSAFHDDAIDNHTGQEERVRERVPRAVGLAQQSTLWTSHNICNELIQVDGDVAHSEAYLVAFHRVEHEGREVDFVLGARYVDRFERRAGEWRIARRTVIHDWQRFDEVRDPPAGLALTGYFDQGQHGTRSRQDFSYQYLVP
jgi:ketosteroid isomerase-like protein